MKQKSTNQFQLSSCKRLSLLENENKSSLSKNQNKSSLSKNQNSICTEMRGSKYQGPLNQINANNQTQSTQKSEKFNELSLILSPQDNTTQATQEKSIIEKGTAYVNAMRALQTKISQYQNESNNFKEQMQKEKGKNTELFEQLEQQQEVFNRLEANLKEKIMLLENQYKILQDEMNQKEFELSSDKEKIIKQKGKNTKFKEQIQQLQKEKQELMQQCSKYQQMHRQVCVDMKKFIEDQEQDKKQFIDEMLECQNKFQQKLKEQEKSNGLKKKEIANLTEENQKIKQQFDEFQSIIKEKQEEINIMKEKMSQLENINLETQSQQLLEAKRFVQEQIKANTFENHSYPLDQKIDSQFTLGYNEISQSDQIVGSDTQIPSLQLIKAEPNKTDHFQNFQKFLNEFHEDEVQIFDNQEEQQGEESFQKLEENIQKIISLEKELIELNEDYSKLQNQLQNQEYSKQEESELKHKVFNISNQIVLKNKELFELKYLFEQNKDN